MLRKKPMIWLGVLALPLLGWLALVVTSHGFLIRYDPMAGSETEPSIITDVACIYLTGTGIVTVFSLSNTKDAECSRLYKLGSLPVCPREVVRPSNCEDRRDR
jgi:hypothetical protein